MYLKLLAITPKIKMADLDILESLKYLNILTVWVKFHIYEVN